MRMLDLAPGEYGDPERAQERRRPRAQRRPLSEGDPEDHEVDERERSERDGHDGRGDALLRQINKGVVNGKGEKPNAERG